MQSVLVDTALLPDGWADNVRIDIDAAGFITRVQADARADIVPGTCAMSGRACVPGMPNVHSHAFQRAMAGLAEGGGSAHSSFWTWRNLMYKLVGAIGPDDLKAIATLLYCEMLEAGYTSVGEFHYLHHAPDGQPYETPTEMSGQILEAVKLAGLGMTLLPVFYRHSDFGDKEPEAGQNRFINSPDDFLALVTQLQRDTATDPTVRIGIAPHSLRAVMPDELDDICSGYSAVDPDGPVHIHIAEQMKEVTAAEHHLGSRPVNWLLDRGLVNKNWCLIHATHMTATETSRLAESGAVAGLCITTEGNLGDGFFPAQDYINAGGRFGIGSDSNVRLDPAEELRWLEYQNRLQAERRTVLGDTDGRSVGRVLFDRAVSGGAAALGRMTGSIAPGYLADLVFLDRHDPWHEHRDGDLILDSWIFGGSRAPVCDVMSAGHMVVEAGRHRMRAEAEAAYRTTLGRLTGLI